MARREALRPFHVHRGHEFEGFQIEAEHGATRLVARCTCGEVLGVADAAFAPCRECGAAQPCPRCGGTGRVVDHARLRWHLGDEPEENVDDL